MSQLPTKTDQELDRLIDRMCDQVASVEELAALGRRLAEDPAARGHYIAALELHARLAWQMTPGQAFSAEELERYAEGSGGRGQGSGAGVRDSGLGVREPEFSAPSHAVGAAAELPCPLEAPSPEPLIPPIITDTSSGFSSPGSSFGSSLGGWLFSYGVATLITGLAILGAWAYTIRHDLQVRDVAHSTLRPTAPEGEPQRTFVGRITDMADCRWTDRQTTPVRREVAVGQAFSLSSGLMEIAYQSGAKVILQGPCTYEVESAAGGYLSLGKLTARVETKGEGGRRKAEGTDDQKSPFPLLPSPFVVRTPTAVVTDLGTEFGVEVDPAGITRSRVFRGAVTVRPRSESGDDQASQITVVRENESVRVESPSGDGGGRHVVAFHSDGSPTRFVRNMPPPKKRTPITVLAYFRLGEDDPGAAAGKPVGKETVNRAGPWPLTKYGSPRYTAEVAAPGSSLAVRFSGAGRECFFRRDLYQSPMDHFVLEGWIRIHRATPCPTYLFYSGDPSWDGYGLLLGEDGLFVHFASMPSPPLAGTAVPGEIGKWIHLALVVCERGTNPQLWVNGRLVRQYSPLEVRQPHGPFSIGGEPESIVRYPGDAHTFDGDIDEVRLSEFAGRFDPSWLLFQQSEETGKQAPLH